MKLEWTYGWNHSGIGKKTQLNALLAPDTHFCFICMEYADAYDREISASTDCFGHKVV